jgi:hypothetical protein
MKKQSLVVLSIVALSATVVFSAALAGQQRAGQAVTPAAPAPRPAAAAPAGTATKAAAPAAAKPYVVKKTPDGQPDLQGYWTNATITPLERAATINKEFFTEEEYAANLKNTASREEAQTTPGTEGDVHYDFSQFGLDTSQSRIPKNLRTSLVIDPPDGRLAGIRVGAAPAAGPVLAGTGPAAAGAVAAPAGGGRGGRGGGGAAPAAAAPAAGRGAAAGGRGNTQYDQVQNINTGTRCITAGGAGPPMMDAGYNAVYQIHQSPGFVTILTEMIHDIRIVPIDPPNTPRPAPPKELKQWVGYSRGHWEGNTLVIETTNFNGRIGAARGATVNGRIVEKFTRASEDRIEYTFTVYDESQWTKPWTASVPLEKEKGPIFEFACHETNYGVANTLAAVRLAEKEAAAAAAGGAAAPAAGQRGQ